MEPGVKVIDKFEYRGHGFVTTWTLKVVGSSGCLLGVMSNLIGYEIGVVGDSSSYVRGEVWWLCMG